ncbi:MAG TPA: prepilin-type N-terminal cleavage/methylation domain-containing protein [Verrucomicrobiae bacterium]|nr:prepilin-type N-terminal cleavage/methylation domain-containing protein [Verrucomicrobiae bacterium]
MKTPVLSRRGSAGGFTLVEMAVSFAILTLVTIGAFNVFCSFLRSYNASTLMRTSGGRATTGMDRMVYGVGTNIGLREAGAASVTVTYSNTDWTLTYTNLTDSAAKYFKYSDSKNEITDWAGKLICTNVILSTCTDLTTGCQITMSVAETSGGRTITNSVMTFVQFRN